MTYQKYTGIVFFIITFITNIMYDNIYYYDVIGHFLDYYLFYLFNTLHFFIIIIIFFYSI